MVLNRFVVVSWDMAKAIVDWFASWTGLDVEMLGYAICMVRVRRSGVSRAERTSDNVIYQYYGS
jgi:hypothetical protein